MNTPVADRNDRPAVLFLCVHNAGRSQMALGFPVRAWHPLRGLARRRPVRPRRR